MIARVALGAEEFRQLVSGEVVRDRGPRGLAAQFTVEIILSDIGWDVMQQILDEARAKREGGA